MPTTLRLAWRNLGRNARRTLITGLALAMSTALCIAYYALVDGMNAQLVHALTRFDLGHVQIHQRDYPADRSLELTLPDADAALRTARGQAGVQAASARVYAPALVGADSRAIGVLLVGVDPAMEPEVTELDHYLAKGGYLDAQPTPWPTPRKLTATEKAADQQLTDTAADSALQEIDELESTAEAVEPADKEEIAAAAPKAPKNDAADRATARRLAEAIAPRPRRPPRVLLGSSLAKVLGVQVGDRLHVSTQRSDGAAEGIFVDVVGIFETGTPLFDRSRIYFHLTDLQRLVHLEGRAHEIAVALDSADAAPEVASALSQAIGSDEVLVRGWSTIRPDIVRMLDLNRVSTAILSLIIFFVATLGVVNTMLMSVLERTRELGMLKAVGMSSAKVFALIVLETLIMALAAAVVGTGIGLGLDLYLVNSGVDLSFIIQKGFTWSGVGFSSVFYGAITTEGVLMPTAILTVVSLLASIYPAARAARMQPAVGMRET